MSFYLKKSYSHENNLPITFTPLEIKLVKAQKWHTDVATTSSSISESISVNQWSLFILKLKIATVILLQIVMVSLGTKLKKNHVPLSITNESQFKKNQGRKNWKCLGLYVTRL